MTEKTATLLAVGDMIVDGPDSDSLFVLAAPVLKSADIVIVTCEEIVPRSFSMSCPQLISMFSRSSVTIPRI